MPEMQFSINFKKVLVTLNTLINEHKTGKTAYSANDSNLILLLSTGNVHVMKLEQKCTSHKRFSRYARHHLIPL